MKTAIFVYCFVWFVTAIAVSVVGYFSKSPWCVLGLIAPLFVNIHASQTQDED